jgi:hypothetical protein
MIALGLAIVIVGYGLIYIGYHHWVGNRVGFIEAFWTGAGAGTVAAASLGAQTGAQAK